MWPSSSATLFRYRADGGSFRYERVKENQVKKIKRNKMESTSEGSGTSTQGGFTRLQFFNFIKNILKDDMTNIYARTEKFLSEKQDSEYFLADDEKGTISDLVFKMRKRWNASSRTEDVFLKKNHDWLQKSVELKEKTKRKDSEENKSDEKKPNSGRPQLSFSESSARSKRRKTEDLRTTVSTEALLYSATSKLRSEGNTDFAKVVHDISEGSPTKATKYRRSLDLVNTNLPFTNDEALSLFIELGLSQSKYQQLRNAHLQKKSKMIPSYKKLHKEKLKCYPASGLSITANEAEVKLQPLLDHTIERIILYQIEVMKTLSEKKLENLTLIGKWGCDGSSGHSEYKQKLDENSSSDESVFFTSYVPLQLVHVDTLTKETTVVWKNPRPSSPRFCRPIKIECAKESVNLTKKTTDYVEQQIKNLNAFETTINGKKVCVKYILTLTMIDTKVCNSLSDTTSAMRCYLCNCTSKSFNDIDKMLNQEICTDHLKFGLSSLHCWIRCFEFLLHLSYKLEILKWQARSKEEKESVEKRKRIIQAAFKTELGLNVDKPKAGSGTSNDGNTARCFFEKYQKSAQITGIDQDIIHRFYIILQAISCGHDINVDNFRQYAVELAKKIVKLFDWYYMPTLVHKLLIHGPEIIQHSVLPIGQMSEDAQEACNKFFRIYRLHFARKNYRQKTMEDVFKRFLVASDPYISSCRKLPVKPLKSLSTETIHLLSPPSVNIQEEYEQEMVESSSASESGTDVETYDSYDNENFFL